MTSEQEPHQVRAMPIEWGKVREFAIATGNTNPDYVDNPSAPIPPTFLATVVFWDEPGRGMRTPEAVRAVAELGSDSDTDIRNVLSLEQEYRFTGPLPRVGERLLLTHRFDGAEVKEGKRGGRMLFTRFAVEFRDPDTGEVRAECLYTSARTSQAAVEGRTA
jgi:MaoC dehydratase-like protein